MKKIFVLVLSLYALCVSAQENKTVLAVSGQSKLKVSPDVTVIQIELNSTNLDYSKSISALQKKSGDLKAFLKDKGVDAKYIKSENFQVEKQYAYERETRKYLGYMSHLWVRLEFQNNNDLANTIVNAIGASSVDAEVSIEFEVSTAKQDSINNKLIELAILDAKTKAELIAKTTNQKILKIERINYGVKENLGFDEAVMYERAGVMSKSLRADQANFTITPKDVEQQTKIIIYWQLGNL